ncbi:MAG: DUF2569 domain-containing protein [Nitrospirae bacterium]|nr:DUF2569 domain-containing protein [Nitrospirota bacterium]
MAELKKTDNTTKKLEGIGGWLILVAIGLIFNPLRMLVSLGKDLLPAFSSETWAIMTTPGTEAYHPLWAPLLIFELAGNSIFIIFSIIAAIMFFRKKKIFPKMIIIFLLSNLVFVAADYFAAKAIPLIANQNDPESVRELARTLIGCLIWVPYFIKSKRVKTTFVK